jgi:hypothetical protein
VLDKLLTGKHRFLKLISVPNRVTNHDNRTMIGNLSETQGNPVQKDDER